MLADDTISSKQAKEVFCGHHGRGRRPRGHRVEARGMKQVSDTGAIEARWWTRSSPPTPTRGGRGYRDGNTEVIGFFVGQCMKAMRGQGNPKIINELLAKKLAE
ncbi:MAG: hypothetical protein ACLTDR_12090 [Adlercreutzia equolifaciens]